MKLKKRVKKLILKSIVTTGCLLASLAALGKHEYVEIEVRAGDNLWLISERYESHTNLSNTEFVRWVERKNNIINGRIYPTQKIIIPVKRGDV
ncbi:MAG TPA: LysM peptidoglycan-binding domain-containing protein [Metabacillus sp.]|nr:LysM peptidoglycan-binding domain-containing protein [Metabacillus sp.]